MKNKLTALIVTFCLVFSVFSIPATDTAHAAVAGSTVSNAVNAYFGSTYIKSWTRDTDHLNHYVKFTVPERGMVKLTATKPYDSEGEYGRLKFRVYNDYGDLIYGSDTYYSVDDVRDSYSMFVGLEPGEYYMTLLPGFTVTSGIIETYYSLSFTADPYCEVEANESIGQATPLTLGKMSSGYFGSDGFMDAGDYDYYKINLKKGTKYKVSMGNYGKVEPTTMLMAMVDPSGDSSSLGFGSRIDENGINYTVYTAETSGIHYIRVYNYGKNQIPYTIGVSEQQLKKQTITTDKTVYNVPNLGDTIDLNAQAETDLTYKSSDTSVCVVYYDGEVYVRGNGTAVITITAEASDEYASATKKVTINGGKKAVEAMKKSQSISVATKFDKTYGNKAFSLKAKAKTKLSYKSSNTKVVKVSSSGKVTIKGTGTATITVKAASSSKYKGASKKVTINVKPKKISSPKLKASKKKFTVSWKKDSKATGYRIAYTTDKNFKKDVKYVKISKNKTVKKTISKLKSKKTYYVKVQAYKKSGSKTLYGSYSSVKKVKVK